MARVRVIGAGPAGTAAAISALQAGAEVDLFEKSRFPRHKVCGEFVSPEATELLDGFGVDWRSANPAHLRRLMLSFGARESVGNLPETAFGLSRYVLDALLLNRAIGLGVTLHREPGVPSGPTVMATGRHSAAPKGDRLFGFKAHFCGPSSDVMALYFQKGGAYVGVNAIESGMTNVCGLAPERELAKHGFEVDAYLDGIAPVRERLVGMKRRWSWIRVGPLVFENRFSNSTKFTEYYTGDSLSFVDPFTGSGIYSALLTGRMAGRAAAAGESIVEYGNRCKRMLARPRLVSKICRVSISIGIANWAERLIPHRWLFRLTRPERCPTVRV
ncbi:MAG: FAD-dependent oxidoreductase [Bryobacteraceae bacterium]